MPTCYRHPDRETGLSCSECGRPICTECMTAAPVGLRCPEHAGAARKVRRPAFTVPRRQVGRLGSDTFAPVTRALIAINVAIYLITAVQGSNINSPGGSLYGHFALIGDSSPLGPQWPFGDVAHDHQWWR